MGTSGKASSRGTSRPPSSKLKQACRYRRCNCSNNLLHSIQNCAPVV